MGSSSSSKRANDQSKPEPNTNPNDSTPKQEMDASSNSYDENDNFVIPPGTCSRNICGPSNPIDEDEPPFTAIFPVENQNTTN